MTSGSWGKTAFLSVQSCAARRRWAGSDRGHVVCASIVLEPLGSVSVPRMPRAVTKMLDDPVDRTENDHDL
jgi:hypothetical protein